jgi:iron complex transport system permease protein
LLVTGLALGVVTSICGPLAFLGLATPHVYRFFHPKRGHLDSIRGIGAWGALLALLADGVVRFTDSWALHWPLNAVLAILGAPVVLAVLWKRTHDWS